MRETPCRYCVAPKRHIGCHGKCQEYIDWKAEWDAFQKEQKRERLIDRQVVDDLNKNLRRRKYR